MTKKQYNDDSLYQEIMASLEPGAAEYDRMMASGEAPAKRKRVSSLVWYAAAAAVIGLVVISTKFFVNNENDGQNIASTDTIIPKEKHISVKQKVETEETDNNPDEFTARTETETKQDQRDSMSSSKQAIYTAKLPEVVFSSVYNDSTTHQNSTGMVMTHDEIK